MAIREGDRIPDVKVMIPGRRHAQPAQTGEILGHGKVVLFAVPGAFTPGCSNFHLPGFVLRAADLRAKGIDRIACIAVNDAFVMKAWGDDQNVGDAIVMIGDGNGDFAKAMGLEMDGSGFGLGSRSQRIRRGHPGRCRAAAVRRARPGGRRQLRQQRLWRTCSGSGLRRTRFGHRATPCPARPCAARDRHGRRPCWWWSRPPPGSPARPPRWRRSRSARRPSSGWGSSPPPTSRTRGSRHPAAAPPRPSRRSRRAVGSSRSSGRPFVVPTRCHRSSATRSRATPPRPTTACTRSPTRRRLTATSLAYQAAAAQRCVQVVLAEAVGSAGTATVVPLTTQLQGLGDENAGYEGTLQGMNSAGQPIALVADLVTVRVGRAVADVRVPQRQPADPRRAYRRRRCRASSRHELSDDRRVRCGPRATVATQPVLDG